MRRGSSRATAIAAIALAGCASITESRTVHVVSSQRVVGPVERQPARDNIDVTAKLADGAVEISVKARPVCTASVADQQLVDLTTHRKRSAVFGVEAAAFVTGAALTTVGLLTNTNSCAPDTDCTDYPPGFFLLLVGVPLAAGGGTATAIDFGRGVDSTRRVRALEVRAPEVRACPAPVAPLRRILTLEFADGSHLGASVVDGGTVRLPLGDAVWRGGDTISPWVSVDGPRIRQLLLRRQAPPVPGDTAPERHP